MLHDSHLVFNSNTVEREGHDAYKRNVPRTRNPYEGTAAQPSWALGWTKAAIDKNDFSWVAALRASAGGEKG